VVLTLGQDPINGDFCAGFTVKADININGAFAATGSCDEGETWSVTKNGDWVGWAEAYSWAQAEESV